DCLQRHSVGPAVHWVMDEKIDHRGFVVNPGELLQNVAAVFHIVHAFQINNHVHCIDGADLHHNVKQVLHENLIHFIAGFDTPAILSLAERGRVDFSERLVLLEYFEPGIQHSGEMPHEYAG